jgi:hypothetical protein
LHADAAFKAAGQLELGSDAARLGQRFKCKYCSVGGRGISLKWREAETEND